ncbi:hypothetical protein ACFSQQ_19275 [Mesorhizobium kowhaii]|uniref:hypothetical protein n=1 Tax=Mesorhizobium kowhaii TaxID=1300272 RepID=UPI0035E7D2D5
METLVQFTHDASRVGREMDWRIMALAGTAILVGMAVVFWSGRKSRGDDDRI